MNQLFQINFRREAFRRERTQVRHRAIGLGVWLTYFGALSVLLGLYGLNLSALASRTRQLEKLVVRERQQRSGAAGWLPSATEATTVHPWVADAGRWRDLLGRLPRLLPDGARLTSLDFNPDGVTGSGRKLLISGVLRADGTRDRMSGVTGFVATLAGDSLFAASFGSVRLVSTRAPDGGGDAEFQVECR